MNYRRIIPPSPETAPASSARRVLPGRQGAAARAARGQEHALVDQDGNDTSGLAVAGADDGRDVAAREFATIDRRFEGVGRFGGKSVEANFFFRPHQDARTQSIGLHQTFHERDLVDADREEESGEFGQILFRQVSSAIEIVTPWQIARGEVAFVGIDITRETARDGPDSSGVESLMQRRVRHKPCNAAIAVNERMNPEKAMMCRCRRQDGVRLAESCRPRLEREITDHYREPLSPSTGR